MKLTDDNARPIPADDSLEGAPFVDAKNLDSEPDHNLTALHVGSTEAKSSVTILPVGTQSIRVPPHIAAHVRSLGSQATLSLDGTRVWLQSTKGVLGLHLGDVDRGALGD